MNDRVRFVKSYTNHVGRAFMRFSLDGATTLPGIVDVCVRESRDGLWQYTRAEAKEIARERLV